MRVAPKPGSGIYAARSRACRPLKKTLKLLQKKRRLHVSGSAHRAIRVRARRSRRPRGGSIRCCRSPTSKAPAPAWCAPPRPFTLWFPPHQPPSSPEGIPAFIRASLSHQRPIPGPAPVLRARSEAGSGEFQNVAPRATHLPLLTSCRASGNIWTGIGSQSSAKP